MEAAWTLETVVVSKWQDTSPPSHSRLNDHTVTWDDRLLFVVAWDIASKCAVATEFAVLECLGPLM